MLGFWCLEQSLRVDMNCSLMRKLLILRESLMEKAIEIER